MSEGISEAVFFAWPEFMGEGMSNIDSDVFVKNSTAFIFINVGRNSLKLLGVVALSSDEDILGFFTFMNDNDIFLEIAIELGIQGLEVRSFIFIKNKHRADQLIKFVRILALDDLQSLVNASSVNGMIFPVVKTVTTCQSSSMQKSHTQRENIRFPWVMAGLHLGSAQVFHKGGREIGSNILEAEESLVIAWHDISNDIMLSNFVDSHSRDEDSGRLDVSMD